MEHDVLQKKEINIHRSVVKKKKEKKVLLFSALQLSSYLFHIAFKYLDMTFAHCVFNPFTVPACNVSGLKSARTRLQTVYFLVL